MTDDLKAAYLAEGTIKGTAKRVGVSYTTARSRLIEAGLITPRERRYRLISMTGATPDEIAERVRASGLTPMYTDGSVWPEVAAPRKILDQLFPEYTIADMHLR